MRVLLAPDSFGGTLTAVEAAAAMRAGWLAERPGDDVRVLPMSDGGPGFLDAMPGVAHELTVEGPDAQPVQALFKVDGKTGYVEVAQACGLHLTKTRDPGSATTYGVGQLVKAAAQEGATTVVLGLGGSATNDGGAGMLAALGVRREDVHGERLDPGGLPLADAHRLVGQPIEVRLVAATDVDSPLLGPTGATHVFAAQKGATDLDALERAVAHWADLLEEHLGRPARDLPGAGAAGGIGFAVLATGGVREEGAGLVARHIGLQEALDVDLVITGEGSFDRQSLRGKVAAKVAQLAQQQGVPCVVLAGQVAVGGREMGAAGVEQAYSLEDEVGLERALAAPHEALATLARRAARDWGA